MLYRHGVTFLLNMLFPLALSFALGASFSIAASLSLVGLVLLFTACFWMSFVIAILCTRFRDIVQIVTSLLNVAMFLTPILWKPEMLPPDVRPYLAWNPLAVLISVVRDPLLDRPVPLSAWSAAVGIAFGGLLFALPFIGRFRRRLVYWL
jgi:lipopolysaccharide transport system permease protein